MFLKFNIKVENGKESLVSKIDEDTKALSRRDEVSTLGPTMVHRIRYSAESVDWLEETVYSRQY